MKRYLEFLKSALVTGLVIVVPAWLALLLLVKLLVKLGLVVKPISSQMPRGLDHPQIVAVAVFLLLCLLVGLAVHTAAGRLVIGTLGDKVFNRVPGFRSLRSIARQFGELESSEGFKPALIEVEDGCLAPAFLIEIHDLDRGTVFMPSVPTPMAGSLFIMPMARVHPLDVPVAVMMKCISKWGAGSADLLAALARGESDGGPGTTRPCGGAPAPDPEP